MKPEDFLQVLQKVQLDSDHKQAITEVLVPLPPAPPVPLGSLGHVGVISDQPGWPGPGGPGAAPFLPVAWLPSTPVCSCFAEAAFPWRRPAVN